MKQTDSLIRILKTHWLAILLAILFTAVFFWLNNLQYLTFFTRAPDADRFNQAIWNTLQGRLLYTTMKEGSILSNHFTPYMALLAPLFLIWEDIRILYFVQIAGFAVAGLFLYAIAYDKRPSLAPWFLLAFFLNPALHNVALFELRRVTLALPFYGLIIYSIYKKDRKWMIVGIIFALLTKEEVGLVVSGIGLFLLLVDRDWKWGLPLMGGGIVWTIGMQTWVIPAMGEGNYPPIGYFAAWGNSFDEMLLNMLRQPVKVVQTMFDSSSLTALWQLLWPVALLLPLLGGEYLLIPLPLLAVMLLSSDVTMHTLQRWYLASILPFIFAAIGVGLGRVPLRWGRWLTALLLLTTVASVRLYSPTPLGQNYQSYRYQRDARQALAWDMIEAVPDDAIIAAQSAFTTQLAQREIIYRFPWYNMEEADIPYFLLAQDFNAYPYSSTEIYWEIMNRIADPAFVVEMEGDGVYLLHQGGEPLPSITINRIADESIQLEKVEVATANEDGLFETTTMPSVQLELGQQLRVSLYWRALAAPNVERTVSLRITDASGAILAQKDTQPSDGARPTSWWQPGWYFRDVYYLTVLEKTAVSPQPASLDLLLYDSFTQERVPFDNGEALLHLMSIEWVE